MAEPLPRLISILKTQGVFEIYLPFLLTFAIFYGLLRKIGIFGGTKVVNGQVVQDPIAGKVTAVVAFVAAAYVTIFSPAAVPISQFFANFFTQSSIALVLLMVFAMIVTMFLGLPFLKQDEYTIWDAFPIVLIVGLLIVLGMFVSSGGIQLFTKFLPPGSKISGEDIALVVLITITVLIIAFLIREPGTQSKKPKWILMPGETPPAS